MGPAKEERTMEYVLTTEALTKRYKHFSALNGLSLHVPKGAIYGLVGQNGAGKRSEERRVGKECRL